MFELGYWPDKGYVLNGNVLDVPKWLMDMHCTPALVIADPPYGNILDETWDKQTEEQLLQEWIVLFKNLERFGAPIYWWGGIGKPGYRPFLKFILQVESETSWRMRDLITWKKVRAYGKSTDYLFVREECAVFSIRGEKYPQFHIPLLAEKRGYPGYNAKYPAKSEYKRRGNVWVETELLKDKLHPAQKAAIVCSVPIESHTQKNELVLDLYSGSGETSVQAIKLGRTFVAVERDKDTASRIVTRLENEMSKIVVPQVESNES
jgi:DNA modification methylase